MTYLEAVNRYLDLVRVDRIAAVSGATGIPAIAKWLVNEAQRDLFYAHDWPWRRKNDVLQTVAPYETGTVTVTLGSTTLTGSGTTFTSAMVGRKFRLTGDLDFYEISAYVSATEVTLADAYVNATQSGIAYSIYQDVYALATDMDRILGMQAQDPDTRIIFGTDEDVYEFEPNPTNTGSPEAVIVSERSSAGTAWNARFWPIPSDIVQLQYQYMFEATDLSTDAHDFETLNRIPPKLHQLIVDKAYIRGLGSGTEDDPLMASRLNAIYERNLEREKSAAVPDKGRWKVMRDVAGGTRRHGVRWPTSYPGY